MNMVKYLKNRTICKKCSIQKFKVKALWSGSLIYALSTGPWRENPGLGGGCSPGAIPPPRPHNAGLLIRSKMIKIE